MTRRGRCAEMEKAAALLADAGNPPLAPHLAANIRAAVGTFRPACVLDQLKACRAMLVFLTERKLSVLWCKPLGHTL